MITGKGGIRASIEEGKIRVSTGKGRNPGEYRKWGIRASTGKVKIRASTENGESG